MLSLGESKADIVKLMAVEMKKRVDASGKTSDVMQAALEEIKEIASTVLALRDPREGIEAIVKLSSAKMGARLLVKQTIGHSSFWRNLELKARSMAQSSKSIVPEIKKLEGQLESTEPLDWDSLAIRIRELPAWEDRVLPGAFALLASNRALLIACNHVTCDTGRTTLCHIEGSVLHCSLLSLVL